MGDIPFERVIEHAGLRAIIQFDYDAKCWQWTFAYQRVVMGTAPDLGTAEHDVRQHMEHATAEHSHDLAIERLADLLSARGAASSQQDDD